MAVVPKSLANLVEALGLLPGVGPRTAERYAHYLLKDTTFKTEVIATALNKLHAGVGYCPVTFALIDSTERISPLYSDSKRDKQVVAVVADSFDIVAIESTNAYHGTYHVIGGLISPIDGISPEQLRIKELISRIDKDRVKEMILATNASVEGESTVLYILQAIGDRPLRITRLARGLPAGVDLEYADQSTLTQALAGRQLLG